MKDLKIIDFERFGNVVRFYLGRKDMTKWYGDDWDDAPYNYNAGTVYDEFVEDTVDVAFSCDSRVLEPCDNWQTNCSYCKDDMAARDVPCIIVIPPEIVEKECDCDNFDRYSGSMRVLKVYFGDDLDSVKKQAEEKKIQIHIFEK